MALSVLGGNAGSLVGVAISASLLPPAVNCGIFWAASIVIAMSSDDTVIFFDSTLESLQVEDLTNNTVSVSGYTPRYDNDNMPMEAFYLGLISLFLTLVNILCIILTGVLILRVKEVTSEKIHGPCDILDAALTRYLKRIFPTGVSSSNNKDLETDPRWI